MDPELEEKKRMDQAAVEAASPQAAQPAPQPHIPNSAALAMMDGDRPSGRTDLGAQIMARMDWSSKSSKKGAKADQWYRDLEDQIGKKGIKHILKGKESKGDKVAFQKAVERLQGEGGDLTKQTLKMLKQGSGETALFAQRYRDMQKKTQKKQEIQTSRYQKDMAKLDKEEKLLQKKMAHSKDKEEIEELARYQEELDRKRAKEERRYASTMEDRKAAKQFLKEKKWERERARKDRR